MYRHTLFNSPLVMPIFYGVAWLGLRLTGWRVVGRPPLEEPKFVVIAYPHTSNWDFPLTIAVSLICRLKVYWMGKSSLFLRPFGPLMKWLGGIPINLHHSENRVQQTINAFNQSSELILIIAPEGNRSHVQRWRTGFYHIALGARVPIVLGYLDFQKKQGGYLKTFIPTGDMAADLNHIKSAYQGIKGKYADQAA